MSTLSVMFFGCPTCHRVRPLKVGLSAGEIGKALRRQCITCGAGQAGRASHTVSQMDSATYLANEIAFISECPETAAKRLGTTPEALARRFYRVGMIDLARQFQAVATRQRYARRRKAA